MKFHSSTNEISSLHIDGVNYSLDFFLESTSYTTFRENRLTWLLRDGLSEDVTAPQDRHLSSASGGVLFCEWRVVVLLSHGRLSNSIHDLTLSLIWKPNDPEPRRELSISVTLVIGTAFNRGWWWEDLTDVSQCTFGIRKKEDTTQSLRSGRNGRRQEYMQLDELGIVTSNISIFASTLMPLSHLYTQSRYVRATL